MPVSWGNYPIKQLNITKKTHLIYSHNPIAYIDNSHIHFIYMHAYTLGIFIYNIH